MEFVIIAGIKKLSVEKSEEECRRFFNNFAKQLLNDEEAENQEELQTKKTTEVSSEPCNEEEVVHRDDSNLVSKPQENVPERKGYTGFLAIKCKDCGDISFFCSKTGITASVCRKCSSKTELNSLKKLFVNCECGRRSRYLTNITERMLDVDCIVCGSPVPVQYNVAKNLYSTISDR